MQRSAGLPVARKLAVLAFALLLSSCSSAPSSGPGAGPTSAPALPAGTPSQQLVDAAGAEGAVVLYAGTSPADNDRLVKGFNAVYPTIKVTVVRATPTALNPQIEAEVRTNTPTADVYFSTDRRWLLDHTDLLTPIQSPAAAAHYAPWTSGDGRIVGFQFHPGGIEWNKDELPDGVPSFQDLATLPADLTIGVADPKLSTGAMAWQYAATTAFGDDWLKAVLNHQVRFYPESTSLVQAIASGEVQVGMPAFLSVARDAERSGAPVASTAGSPSIVSLMTAAILKPGKHPSAAQLLVDFVLSPAGQATMAQDKLSPLPDIPGAVGVVEPGVTNVADPSAVSATDQAAFMKRFDSYARRG